VPGPGADAVGHDGREDAVEVEEEKDGYDRRDDEEDQEDARRRQLGQ
jgi:hypothetical protein